LRRDAAADESYWRQELAGIEEPAKLNFGTSARPAATASATTATSAALSTPISAGASVPCRAIGT
jgi:hypothetical protein